MQKIIAAVVAGLVIATSAYAANITSLFGSIIGPSRQLGGLVSSGAPTTTALGAVNSGWAARHVAGSTLDVKAVKIHWGTITAAGQVRIRYEAIDTATGKPSNSAYDANATLAGQTPTTGVTTYTFASLPTTGRTVGGSYAVTVVTTTGGTTHTLNSYISESAPSALPAAVLTTADAGTAWTEVAASTPVVILVMEDDTEVALQEGLSPFSSITAQNLFSTNGVASKIAVPVAMSMFGVDLSGVVKIGTPAGDLRIRVMDSNSNVVSGATVTIDKDNIVTNMGTRGGTFLFASPVTLPAGTYRIVADCTSCADSSNCWRVSTADSMSGLSVPSSYSSSTTANSTATPPTWTDSTSKLSLMRFILSDIIPGGASGVIGG